MESEKLEQAARECNKCTVKGKPVKDLVEPELEPCRANGKIRMEITLDPEIRGN